MQPKRLLARLISTHASLAGRDNRADGASGRGEISTHASLAGRDLIIPPIAADGEISTHASLAGRDGRRGRDAPAGRISTHASLAGRDHRRPCRKLARDISTHASLAGRDLGLVQWTTTSRIFQPTRPLRDATYWCNNYTADDYDFNPRVPCGTRPSSR